MFVNYALIGIYFFYDNLKKPTYITIIIILMQNILVRLNGFTRFL